MIKKIILLGIFILLSLDLNAARERSPYATNNFKGQKYYLDACSECHGAGSRGGNMESINEWKELFSNNASELLKLHLDEDKTQKVISYLRSEKFRVQKVRILPFLQEFAYDSENIPTCY